jgi:hypothetical protein
MRSPHRRVTGLGSWICAIVTIVTMAGCSSTANSSDPGGTVAELSASVQAALRGGKVPGAEAVSDAVVTCGPANASLSLGTDIACEVSSRSVGSALMFIRVDSAHGRSFTTLTIGSDFSCDALTSGEKAAYLAIGNSC